MTDEDIDAVTADEITIAILNMYYTLSILDGMDSTPFKDNVKRAVEGFNNPALRTKMVHLLYGE